MANRYKLTVNFNREDGFSVRIQDGDVRYPDPEKSKSFWYLDWEDVLRWREIIDRSWTLVYANLEYQLGDPCLKYVFMTDTDTPLKDTGVDWENLYHTLKDEFLTNGKAQQVRKTEEIVEHKHFPFTYKDRIAMLCSLIHDQSQFMALLGEVTDFFGNPVQFGNETLTYENSAKQAVDKLTQDYQTFLLENR